MRNEERLIVDGYLYGNEDDVKLAKEEKKTAKKASSKKTAAKKTTQKTSAKKSSSLANEP